MLLTDRLRSFDTWHNWLVSFIRVFYAAVWCTRV